MKLYGLMLGTLFLSLEAHAAPEVLGKVGAQAAIAELGSMDQPLQLPAIERVGEIATEVSKKQQSGSRTNGAAVRVLTGYEDSSEYSSMSLPELEEELDDASLGGPIVMLAIGGGVALIGGVYSLMFLLTKGACDAESLEGDTTCDTFGTIGTVMGVGAIGGALLAGGGGFFLGSRIGTRRKIKREIKKREGTVSWGVTPMINTSGGGLGLSGSF